ncbi:MAG: histidinol dehydrogenase, partial [Ruminiclostridium sp.]|nr:histidinol dehydrogenase [Ruminiclostridium sp.]
MIRKIYADGGELEFLKEVEKRSSETNEKVEKTVREIIADVRANGDKAVKEYTAKFDCPDCQYYEVPQEVINNALTEADPDLVNALLNCVEKITAFHQRQKQNGYMITGEDGTILGQRVRGLDRVGLYVPGGTAAYPSSVLMNAIP